MMSSSIPCGDFELNISHPSGTPTLVPSQALERRLDWRLHRTAKIIGQHDETSDNAELTQLPPLAVHLHVHYVETLPALLQALEACQDGLDNLRLWISTDSSAKAELIEIALQNSCLSKRAVSTKVGVCANKGRNLGPLLHDFWAELKDEELVLHLHSKRSVESGLGEAWLDQLLQCLLPDSDTLRALRHQFQRDSKLGLVMPQPPGLIRPYLNWGSNFELAQQLATPLGRRLHRDAVLLFPAGGMFWFKPTALAPLVECLNIMGGLPPEPLPVDGSSLHALERLAPHACETSGHHWKLFCRKTPIPTSTPGASLSVLLPQTELYQQATALLAARFRKQDEQLECTNVNLDRCIQQLESADATIRDQEKTVQDLEKTVQDLNQTMASSRTWRLTRFLKQLVRAGT